MMKITIGNDFRISWELSQLGEAFTLEGKAYELVVRSSYGVIDVINYVVDGNTLAFTIPASSQIYAGSYDIVLNIEYGDNHWRLCHPDVFELVPCGGEIADIIHLEDNIIYPYNGLSAYELAVASGEYTGDYEGYQRWLARYAEATADEAKEIAEQANATANEAKTKLMELQTYSAFRQITAYMVNSEDSELMPSYNTSTKLLTIPAQRMMPDGEKHINIAQTEIDVTDILVSYTFGYVIYDVATSSFLVRPCNSLGYETGDAVYIFGLIDKNGSYMQFNSKYWKVNDKVFASQVNLTEVSEQLDELQEAVFGVKVEQYKYVMSVNGLPVIKDTTVESYSVTNYLRISDLTKGSIICKPYGLEPYSFAGIYDKDFKPLACLTSSDSSRVNYNVLSLSDDLSALGVIDTACYIIFCASYPDTDNGFVALPKSSEYSQDHWWTDADIYNYEQVLKMPKDVVKAMVETSSCGKCTALYDDDGYPSLMYKVPIMSIGQFDRELGDLSSPHPAFMVNGVQKNYIYISVFMTSSYKGRLVSWFGLQPLSSMGITDLRTKASQKGTGWHLETIYERSLISLLTKYFNSPTPHCNNYWGTNKYALNECVEMANGGLPGKNNQGNGAKWINGTQPLEWSHNKSLWGIQDVCGGYHEICDLIKIVDGFLYMPADNYYNGDEDSWVNTGVAIDVIDGVNVMSNTVTSTMLSTEPYISTLFENVLCTEGYDTLSEDLRKKMVLLGISPRLSSSESIVHLGYKGRIQSRPAGIGYIVCGGAEEYDISGLGYYNIAYDLTTVSTHNNMGSRLCYIA